MNEKFQKHKIFIDVRPTSGTTSGVGIVRSDKTIGSSFDKDFYITVFLNKTAKVHEYVDIQKDETIQTIERQEINPYFIEFSFFDTIKRNKINKGIDLTNNMIDFIRNSDYKLSAYTDTQIVDWFNYVGRLRFRKNEKINKEPNLDSIDTIDLVWENIISKSNYFPIDINK